jgi:hypothetical protein
MNAFHAGIAPALAAIGLTILGCGDLQSKQELQLLEESVTAALEAWKRGERADALKSRTPPIEFYDDDWQRSARLVDYQVVKLYPETDGSARCAVSLTVQRRGRQPVQVQATYQMSHKPHLVIARDPYS